jgi:hypothetical protein
MTTRYHSKIKYLRPGSKMADDYAEQQAMELEALESILMDDMQGWCDALAAHLRRIDILTCLALQKLTMELPAAGIRSAKYTRR